MDKAKEATHRITVCTNCRHVGKPCRPGLDLLTHLQAAISQAGAALSDDFSLEGSVCMAGCERPCTVAFQATAKATYLFGDIEDASDIGALVSFAKLYRDRPDGLTREGERPTALGGKTLARIPAAVVSAEHQPVVLQ
jgi:predicted metal-binding protein